MTIGGLQSHRNNPLQLIPLEQDPEDLSLAQQRLRGDGGGRDHHHHRHHHHEKSGSGGSAGGMATISPYGPAAAGLVNRLGLSTKMGKHWLETNMQAAMQQQQQQQQANSPGSNHNASGGGGSTGSALLDTYLQLIAEHSSNMAAVAAAAAAAQNNASGAPNNNNHSQSSEGNHGDRPESAGNAMVNETFVKRSPKTMADD